MNRPPNISRTTRSGSGRTYRDLYAEAQARKLEGRSKMSKEELEAALNRR